jgi:methyltransferase (TIGR00027 family)
MLGSGWTVIGISRLPHRVALWIHEHFVPGLHDYVVARARHIDDRVQELIRDGIAQLVILGAGFDSRAYRIDALRDRVRVFEVDHPASQREKLTAVARAIGCIPDHVTYVPVDFQTQSLADRLLESGYHDRQRTLFVMEGVTMYLQPEAVDATLAFVRARSGAGSSILFDYTFPEVLSGTFPHRSAQGLKKIAAKTGEAFTFGIPVGGAEKFLSPRGFALLEDVDHDALDRAYFSGQPRRRACPIFSIAHAAVR